MYCELELEECVISGEEGRDTKTYFREEIGCIYGVT